MRYRVAIEGRERDVDVTITPSGAHVRLDGAPIDADVRRVPGGLSVRIAGGVFDVAVGGPPESMQLAAGSSRAVARVVSERARARSKRSATPASGENELRAPMPGRVVRVLVQEGSAVEAGDPCVVVEAMKMENELRAPRSAKVAEVHVTEGQSVEGQALLVSFD